MRTAGILMPITSLPSPYGVGTLGQCARDFIQFLHRAGQTYWQILPICPTGYGDSPYQSFSSYAGNPYMIDFDDLKKEGLLQEEEYASISWGDNPARVDYSLLYSHKFSILRIACSRISGVLSERFQTFCKEQNVWLNDYALYMSIKDYYGGQSWQEWPETLQKREKDSLEAIRQELTDEILFWKKVQFLFFYQWDKLKAYAEENNVDFTLLDGQGSGENQVSQIETLIAQGVDCIIVQPYDAAACQVGVEAAIDADIPVLVTKTTIEDNSICPFVGQDDTVAGEMEMEWMAEQLGGKGNIVIIEGPTGISAAIQRNDGIEKTLEKYPDINVLHTQPADWNRDEGMSLMETWLQEGKEIDGVVAHNDEMALGAYDAIADAGKAGEIKVIGIDAIDAAKKSVAAGELDATVLQDVETIGKKTVEVAIEMCKGEKVDDVYNVDPVLLTKDNIADYVTE